MWRGVTDIKGRTASTLNYPRHTRSAPEVCSGDWDRPAGSAVQRFLAELIPEDLIRLGRRAHGRGRVRTQGKPGAMLYLPGTTFGNAQTAGP